MVPGDAAGGGPATPPLPSYGSPQVAMKRGFSGLVASALATLALVGCGGGSGSHTYVLTPAAPRGAGIYLTIVSPTALPQSLFGSMRPKMTIVDRSTGPAVCSYSERHWGIGDRVYYPDARREPLLTMTLSGSNPLLSVLCSGQPKPHAPAGGSSGPTGGTYPVESAGP